MISIDDVIIAFLRKEPFTRGKLRSNGRKLFVDKSCIGQWKEHRVIMNDSEYTPEIKKIQDSLYRWLKRSDLIFRVVTEVPEGSQQILSYYGGE